MFAFCVCYAIPGGNTGEIKAARNWPAYLTMPMAQGKCPLYQALPPPTYASFMGLTFTFYGPLSSLFDLNGPVVIALNFTVFTCEYYIMLRDAQLKIVCCVVGTILLQDIKG